MPSLFEDLTLAKPTPFPKQVVDPVKLKTEQDARQKEWEKALADFEEKIQQEWSAKRKIENKPIFDFDPDLIRQQRYGFRDDPIFFDPSRSPSKQWFYDEKIEAARSYIEYYNQRHKKRFQGLSPENKKVEIGLGGVDAHGRAGTLSLASPQTKMKIETMARGFTDAVFFGAVDTKHPVYGDELIGENELYYTAGNLMGEVMGFMALSQVAAATGIGSKLVKLAQKKEPIRKLLHTIGKPKVWLDDKAPLLFTGLRNISNKYGGSTVVAGAKGVEVGLVRSFSNTLKHLVNKYKTEDRMSTAEWLKTVPVAVKGFWEGYGISVINDPRRWSWRFLGDALWSGGKMGSDILMGQREGWDMKDFYKDMALGHILGEVQGAVFAPSRKQLLADYNNKIVNRVMEYWVDKGYAKTKAEAWYPAKVLQMAHLETVSKGKIPTIQELDGLMVKLGDNFKKDLDIAKTFTHPNNTKLELKDFNILTQENRTKIYENLRRKLNISTGALKNIKLKNIVEKSAINSLMSELRKDNKVTTKAITKEQRLNNIRELDFGYFSKRLHNELKTRFKSLYKDLKTDGDKLSRTLDILSRPQKDTVKKSPTVSKPPLNEEAKGIRDNIVSLVDKNRNGLTRGFKNLERPAYNAEDALSDFMIKLYEADKTFFMENDIAKGWITNKKTILSTVRRQIRNNLINYGKKVKQESSFTPLENVISDRDISAAFQREEATHTNPIYNILLTHTKSRGKASLMRVMTKYLKSLGMNNREIMERFGKFGINVKPATVRQWLWEINKDIDNILNTGRAQPKVSVKTKYNKDEVKQVLKEAKEELGEINEVTGIRKDLTTDGNAVKLIKKDGGYIISLTDFYNNVLLGYNKNIADRVLQESSQIITDLIGEVNANYAPRSGVDLFIKNPTDANNSKFVLYQNGMTKDEFLDNASYIGNTLKNNYTDDDYMNKFSIILTKLDGDVEALESIDNKITFTDTPADIIGTDIAPNKDLPHWKRAKISEDQNFLISTPGQRTPTDTKRVMENRLQRMGAVDEEMIGSQKILNSEDEIDDIAKAIFDSNGMVEKQKRTFRGLFAQGVETLKHEVTHFMNEYFTIFHGLELSEQHWGTVQAIYKAGDLFQRSGNFAGDIIQNKFKGIFDDLSTKQKEQVNRVLADAIENEMYKAIDKETGKPKIAANQIEKKIEFKGNITENLDSYIKSIPTSRDSYKLSQTIKGPLPLTRAINQLYGLKPDKILKLYSKYHDIIQIMEPFAKSKLLPNFSDKEFEWAERIKRKLKDNVLSNMQKYTTEDLTEYDFDAVGSRTKLESIIKAIPLEDIKKKALLSLRWYYKINPEELAYVPHLEISDPKNLGMLSGEINQILQGKVVRGTPALNTILTDIRGRKYVTRFQAIENGLKVSDSGFLEQIWSQLTYLKNKASNSALMDSFKRNYMEGFVAAKDAGQLDEFLRQHGGYFYIPTKSEFKKINQFIKDIDKKVESLSRQPQNTDVINQITNFQNMKSQISFRRQMMIEILKSWKSGDADSMGLRVIENEDFVPLNRGAYEDTWIPPQLRTNIKTYINKHRISAHNIPEADGLYFNRITFKGLNQFVFKDHFMNRSDEPLLRRIGKAYDKINIPLKIWSLWKPTIMYMNDLTQLTRADPRAIAKIPQGFNAINDYKDGVKSIGSDFVTRMSGNNMYNKSVSARPIFTDGYRAVCNLFGKKPYLGKIMEEWTQDKNFFLKLGGTAKKMFKSQQEFAWYLDEGLRTALALQINDRFSKVYGQQRGDLMTAEWVNLHMVNYSRVPNATRQMLNRVLAFPTFRVGNLRYHKEMLKNLVRVAGRAFSPRPGNAVAIPGKENYDSKSFFEPEFKVSERQGLFDVRPTLVSWALKGMMRVALATAFGLGHESIWDLISGYRVKKKEGDTFFDTEMQFLSLSTPLFEMQKHLTRLSRNPKVWLKFNIAKLPGAVWSLAANSHPVSGKKLHTADWKKQPQKAFTQTLFSLLGAYVPMLGDISQLKDDDQDTLKKLVNFSGLGYYYNYKSPRELEKLLTEALDKSKTLREHTKALKDFQFGIRRAHQVLFNEEFKDIADQIEEAKDRIFDIKM